MDEIVSFKGEDESHDRQFVNALARGLEILRCFRPGEIYLTNTELAKRTGLPKPTISRLTHTLTRLGYLEYSEDQGRYQLGSGVLALGYSLLSGMDVRKLARPAMQELADYSQCNVALGIRDRLSMVYIEATRGQSAVTLRRASARAFRWPPPRWGAPAVRPAPERARFPDGPHPPAQ
jgi:DNA-binding IclR family transcriptional regulator